ncbi:hypothetical protein KC363_g178 [Hortaea werneckii]|nr:hypothetical protein KC363_g178 [Hortaea werneckii]
MSTEMAGYNVYRLQPRKAVESVLLQALDSAVSESKIAREITEIRRTSSLVHGPRKNASILATGDRHGRKGLSVWNLPRCIEQRARRGRIRPANASCNRSGVSLEINVNSSFDDEKIKSEIG